MRVRRIVIVYLLWGWLGSPAQAQMPTPLSGGVVQKPGEKWSNLPRLEPGAADLIKINDIQVKEGTVATAVSAVATNPPTPPVGLASLVDGFRVFNYSMSEATAAKLNLILGGGSGAGERRVFVHDFMFYKDDVDAAGTPITWGAGVRLIILARSISASANFSSLPAIAASAQFNYIETSYNLHTIGLSGPKVVLAVPAAGGYDIEKHVALMQAIDAIRDAAADSTTVVTPRLIKLEVREEDTHIQAVAHTMALRFLAAGRSCNDAKNNLAPGHLAFARAAVEAVYRELQGRCSDEKLTSAVVLARVNEYLKQAGWKP